MENKCPNSFCDFVYKVKKKPFKCDLCASYIGTIYGYYFGFCVGQQKNLN